GVFCFGFFPPPETASDSTPPHQPTTLSLYPITYLANRKCDLTLNVIYNKIITFALQDREFSGLSMPFLWQEHNHNDRKHNIERDAGCQ
ncbi:TPA: hypothetical protein ACOEAK_003494, partial [Enterobacter ludwigii]|uniref:hypothetical protein n=1 Tax=Enterobacter ludwigii TaxID=299767 RepID=UPI002A763E7B